MPNPSPPPQTIVHQHNHLQRYAPATRLNEIRDLLLTFPLNPPFEGNIFFSPPSRNKALLFICIRAEFGTARSFFIDQTACYYSVGREKLFPFFGYESILIFVGYLVILWKKINNFDKSTELISIFNFWKFVSSNLKIQIWFTSSD